MPVLYILKRALVLAPQYVLKSVISSNQVDEHK